METYGTSWAHNKVIPTSKIVAEDPESGLGQWHRANDGPVGTVVSRTPERVVTARLRTVEREKMTKQRVESRSLSSALTTEPPDPNG